MNNGRSKVKPLRLGAGEYTRLREAVLRRDSWKCQSCGSMHNLEVHHQQLRSHSGEDKPENLITLCATCHSALHSCRRSGGGQNHDKPRLNAEDPSF